MKKTVLFFMGLLMSMLVTAGPVSQNEALQKARQFTNTKRLPAPAMQLAKRQAMSQAQDRAAYYVFNLGHDRGFVIVSGDDRTPAIIGYTDRGSYDERQMPDNMREWMQEYNRQMEWLGQQPEGPAFVSKAPVRKTISPLLTTLWNQAEPYNSQCPYDGSYRSVTGCVATAMAQVVNYHGQHTGQPTNVSVDIPGYTTDSRSINVSSFPTTYKFQWANMLDEYVSGYTSSQSEAVAKLMLACGTSVMMDYTNGESGAQTSAVAGAMKKYFGYDAATNYKVRSDYSIADWNAMVYAELAESRPVLYDGRSSGGGHAFVVDGFDGDELFHVNWGWGGFQNGYFLLSVLTPSDNSGIGASNTSDGYNYDQGGIFEAQPNVGTVESYPLQLSFSNLMADGSIPHYEARNHTGETAEFDFGFAILNADNTLTPLSYYSSEPLPPGWGYSDLSIDLSYYASWFETGISKVVPISRENGTEEWILPPDIDRTSYVVTKDDDGNITVATILNPILSVANFEISGSKVANEEQEVMLSVENKGDEYYGRLFLFTNTTDIIPTKNTTLTGVTVPKEATANASFIFTPTADGTCYLWVTTDANGKNVIGHTQVEIEGVAGTVSDNVELTFEPYIKNTNAAGNAILGQQVTMVVQVTNNTSTTYQNYVQFSLCRYNPWNYEESQLKVITVPANSTKEFECTFNAAIDPTAIYTLAAYYKLGDSWSGVIWGPDYTVAPMVVTTFADGTSSFVEATASFTVPEGVVAVDLRGNTTTTTIAPNSNGNCLYALSEGATTPAGITANVVKGNVAENITLSDTGLGFYSPVDFTAKEITYTRTFDKGLEPNDDLFGNNWTTICLPFDVQEVTVGSTVVDFMRNAEDTGKNFWLMAYAEDAEGIMAFDHADAFEGYKPYLIAVPDSSAQGHTSMVGSPVVFKGSNAAIKADRRTVVSAEYYKTVGTLQSAPCAEKMFVLDADGKALTAATSAVPPFRAYVTTTAVNSDTTAPDLLIMGNVDVTISGFAMGDVNGDGEVGIADIVAVTNVMAGTETDADRVARADVNNDGEVGIADIVAVTNIMAGK